jgi:DNA (cytosine-5)-methyltransferase 1
MADIKILNILDELNNPMTHASLFSGIGGPEVAAAMLGWENVFHCEINDFGRAILEYHFPKSKSYINVTKTDFTEWRGRVDVLTGGFPCQPFSYAGRRGGAEDDRYLWPQFKRVIAEVRPAWVVGENVAGITTMVEPGEVTLLGSEASLFSEDDAVYRYDQPFTVERVCSDLEQLGYAVQPVLIPACAVGAPHRRDRVFFIAYSEDAMHLRRSKREDEERINSGEHRNTGTGATERHGSEERAITSDTEKQHGQRVRPQLRETCGEEQVGLGGSRGEDEYSDERKIRWTDADTHLNEMEGNIQPGDSREPQQGFLIEKPSDGYRSLQKEYRWRNFPTVSPVHRGNDGIPFPLDCLTISPNKWRTESLKAYGNAIVPQVMYEIFRAIEQVTNQQK